MTHELDALPTDDLDDAIAALDPVKLATTADRMARVEATQPGLFVEQCPKCRGTGTFTGYTGRVFGPCFACKGRGSHTYATSSADRAKSRTQRAERKTRAELDVCAAFVAEHPLEGAWLAANHTTNDFARAMREALLRWGALTERQLAACTKWATPKTPRPSVDLGALDGIVAMFKSAASHLKRPRPVRLALPDGSPLQLSIAGPGARAPGSINVAAGGYGSTWYGRIHTDGRFEQSRDGETKAGLVDFLRRLAAEPAVVAAEYGHTHHACCFCAEHLTDPRSIKVGYGPICAGNYGLPWGER